MPGMLLTIILISTLQTSILAYGNSLFEVPQVHEIRLTFPQESYWDSLYANEPSGTYMVASFEWQGIFFDSVGVRLKGNSSMNYPGPKKPFKIKFNKYVPDQDVDGLKKLNLNNGFLDPTMLREKLMCDYLNNLTLSPRANFARLYLNEQYWGLYGLGEIVDGVFPKDRFGENEDGNLYKGDPHGDLTWQGYDPDSYRDDYDLETNEEDDDWEPLIHFIDILNNTPIADLPDSLQSIFDIDGFLSFLAGNSLFTNLDSYVGTGHNYYLYERDDNNKMVHIAWDMNEAFGNFNYNMPPPELLSMDVFWSHPQQPRPLAERIFQVEEYRLLYLAHLQSQLASWYRISILHPRIDFLASMIRDAVYEDPHKMFTNQEFEQNLTSDIRRGSRIIIGLKRFISERKQLVNQQVITQLHRFDISINEILSSNAMGIQDELGENEDWVELFNEGPTAFDLSGSFLTDDPADPTKWAFPDTLISPGAHIVIWCDNDEEDGPMHASFKLSSNGETVGLVAPDGITFMDLVVYGESRTDVAFGRFPDGGPTLMEMAPTPWAVNTSVIPPWIDKTAFSPSIPLSGEEVLVFARIWDDVAVSETDVYYRQGDGSFTQLVMWDDGLHDDGNAGDSLFAALLPGFSTGTIISFFVRAEDDQDAVTFDPADTSEGLYAFVVEPPSFSVRLNEFMADNDTTVADPQGEFDDWVEIYNLGPDSTDMNGLSLTDDLSIPRKWAFPDTTIPPGGFLLVWCDNDEGDAGLHASFKLAAIGEQIGLFYQNSPIDTLSYGPQPTDFAMGRLPDGSGAWTVVGVPTPGWSNLGNPQHVAILSIARQGNDVVLTWSATAGAESYLIYCSSRPFFTPPAEGEFLGEVSELSFTDLGIAQESAPAYYRIIALNSL